MKTAECIGEVLGMFVFVYIALTQKEPLIIVTGLFVGIMIAASFGSKSYLNPGVVIADYGRSQITKSESGSSDFTGREATSYIGCELLGAVLAIILTYIQHESMKG
jgi:glycerol uptake facilitator-like aquaporin